MIVSDEKSKIVICGSLKARLVGKLLNGFRVITRSAGCYVLFECDWWEIVDAKNCLNQIVNNENVKKIKELN